MLSTERMEAGDPLSSSRLFLDDEPMDSLSHTLIGADTEVSAQQAEQLQAEQATDNARRQSLLQQQQGSSYVPVTPLTSSLSSESSSFYDYSQWPAYTNMNPVLDERKRAAATYFPMQSWQSGYEYQGDLDASIMGTLFDMGPSERPGSGDQPTLSALAEMDSHARLPANDGGLCLSVPSGASGTRKQRAPSSSKKSKAAGAAAGVKKGACQSKDAETKEKSSNSKSSSAVVGKCVGQKPSKAGATENVFGGANGSDLGGTGNTKKKQVRRRATTTCAPLGAAAKSSQKLHSDKSKRTKLSHKSHSCPDVFHGEELTQAIAQQQQRLYHHQQQQFGEEWLRNHYHDAVMDPFAGYANNLSVYAGYGQDLAFLQHNLSQTAGKHVLPLNASLSSLLPGNTSASSTPACTPPPTRFSTPRSSSANSATPSKPIKMEAVSKKSENGPKTKRNVAFVIPHVAPSTLLDSIAVSPSSSGSSSGGNSNSSGNETSQPLQKTKTRKGLGRSASVGATNKSKVSIPSSAALLKKARMEAKLRAQTKAKEEKLSRKRSSEAIRQAVPQVPIHGSLLSLIREANSSHKPNLVKGSANSVRAVTVRRWTDDEDEVLRKAVKKFKSQNWKSIAELVPDRDHVQCLQRWKKVLKPGLVKGAWQPHEDRILICLINRPGVSGWADIAKEIPGRTPKQCRERWSLSLDPSINRDPWSEEEDLKLIEMHNKYGKSWAEIRHFFDGRTENAVKTRFNCIMRSFKRDAKIEWTPKLMEQLIALGQKHDKNLAVVQKRLPRPLKGISASLLRKAFQCTSPEQFAQHLKDNPPSENPALKAAEIAVAELTDAKKASSASVEAAAIAVTPDPADTATKMPSGSPKLENAESTLPVLVRAVDEPEK